jgi:hypothetical protein
LSILSRKVLQSAVASGTSNPQLGGEGSNLASYSKDTGVLFRR